MEKYKPSPEEVRSAEESMSDEEREMSGQREKERDKERFETALNEVCEKYPELAERIKTSLETPQLGEHHNEGPKMDSHLSLILKTLESIKDGENRDPRKELQSHRFGRET